MPNIITVFSSKGGVGKTPISANIAFDYEHIIGTNDPGNILNSVALFVNADRLIEVTPSEAFPVMPEDFPIVFDLGGMLTGEIATSIRSAVEQSSVVLVPVNFKYQSIHGAIKTIQEIRPLNKNIVILATMLRKYPNEKFGEDWSQSRQFKHIVSEIEDGVGEQFPALPLKESIGYDTIFEKELSFRQLVEQGGIEGYTNKLPAKQFEAVYKFLEKNYGH